MLCTKEISNPSVFFEELIDKKFLFYLMSARESHLWPPEEYKLMEEYFRHKICQEFRYLHIPKTGGTFIRHVLGRGGDYFDGHNSLNDVRFKGGRSHTLHPEAWGTKGLTFFRGADLTRNLHDIRVTNIVFTALRNPFDWITSYYFWWKGKGKLDTDSTFQKYFLSLQRCDFWREIGHIGLKGRPLDFIYWQIFDNQQHVAIDFFLKQENLSASLEILCNSCLKVSADGLSSKTYPNIKNKTIDFPSDVAAWNSSPLNLNKISLEPVFNDYRKYYTDEMVEYGNQLFKPELKAFNYSFDDKVNPDGCIFKCEGSYDYGSKPSPNDTSSKKPEEDIAKRGWLDF